MSPNENAGPLAGVRVLSNEVQLAGPYCSMTLADRGAEVIKIERPKYGDSAREGAPIIKNDDGERVSGYFMRFNRNKRSLTLNLKDPKGQEIYRELAAKSDVVIDNLRPGVMEKLGFGYDALCTINPGIIYVSISGVPPRGWALPSGIFIRRLLPFKGSCLPFTNGRRPGRDSTSTYPCMMR